MSDNTISKGGSTEGANELPDRERVPPRVGRRSMILGVAAGGAGVAAGLVAGADPASAAAGKPVKLGKTNTAHANTTVTNTAGTARIGHDDGRPVDQRHRHRRPGDLYSGLRRSRRLGRVLCRRRWLLLGRGCRRCLRPGNGDNGFGIYGTTIGSGGTAVYAAGNATVTGSSAKGGGSFRDRSSAGTGGQISLSLVCGIARHDECLRRHCRPRSPGSGHGATAGLVRVSQP